MWPVLPQQTSRGCDSHDANDSKLHTFVCINVVKYALPPYFIGPVKETGQDWLPPNCSIRSSERHGHKPIQKKDHETLKHVLWEMNWFVCVVQAGRHVISKYKLICSPSFSDLITSWILASIKEIVHPKMAIHFYFFFLSRHNWGEFFLSKLYCSFFHTMTMNRNAGFQALNRTHHKS